MFRVPDLRNKILFTLMMLAIYRLGSHVPVPGIDLSAVKALQEQAKEGGVLSFLQLFSGGALTQFAVFALGIMPYITSSIIMQILTVVIPKLEQWQQQGAVGQRKITQWTRYLTVAIAILQSTGLAFLFGRGGGGSAFFGQQAPDIVLIDPFTVPKVLLVVLSLTAGTVLLMWMGELITQRGIGNGISLMIFASIASGIPAGVQAWWTSPDQIFVVMMPFVALAVIGAIVFVQEGQRRIPVQYAKRVIGRRMSSGGQTYLPLRVNMAGVIPVIFAASIMAFPPTVGQLINTPWAQSVAAFFAPNDWAYIVGESLFIVL